MSDRLTPEEMAAFAAIGENARAQRRDVPELGTLYEQSLASIAKQIAEYLRPRLLESTSEFKGTPWMNAAEAADYLRCPISRVRKMCMTRELPFERDGRRVLFNRTALDAFIRAGGATSV